MNCTPESGNTAARSFIFPLYNKYLRGQATRPRHTLLKFKPRLFDSSALFLYLKRHPPMGDIIKVDMTLLDRWFSNGVQFGTTSGPSGSEGLSEDGQHMEIRPHANLIVIIAST